MVACPPRLPPCDIRSPVRRRRAVAMLARLDAFLMDTRDRPLAGWRRGIAEFLYFGFKEACVGSYVMQAWRLLELRVRHHPPYWMAGLVAAAIYLNFFTHHTIGDARWYLAACALGLYARTTIHFRPLDRERSMPLLLG